MEEIKKYTCKCENCNREFDEEEYHITKDENKCIFHCKKDKEFLMNDDYVKKFHEVFYYFIDNISKERERFINEAGENEKDLKKYEIKNFIFPNFKNNTVLCLNEEEENVNIFNNITEKNIDVVFKNCIFLGDFDFSKEVVNFNLIFKNVCIFEKDISFEETIFNKKFKLINCKIIGNTNFKRTKFNELAGFEKTVFNEASFRNTRFKKKARFIETEFKKNINFEYTYFDDIVAFNEAIVKENINLEKTIFFKSSNFHNIKCGNVANRETARIIKDSFEQQNNIIEANKFYALEMKEREKELSPKKDFFEWLVFKFHGLSSNHSQDWLLALYWIFIIGFISSYYDFNLIQHEGKYVHYELSSVFKTIGLILVVLFFYCICKIKDKFVDGLYFIICFYLVYIYSTEDYLLSLFSQTINPFSVMKTNDPINGIQLFFKIIITYLIYQLIISIRQNTRRK
jgi:hypothetical protein